MFVAEMAICLLWPEKGAFLGPEREAHSGISSFCVVVIYETLYYLN